MPAHIQTHSFTQEIKEGLGETAGSPVARSPRTQGSRGKERSNSTAADIRAAVVDNQSANAVIDFVLNGCEPTAVQQIADEASLKANAVLESHRAILTLLRSLPQQSRGRYVAAVKAQMCAQGFQHPLANVSGIGSAMKLAVCRSYHELLSFLTPKGDLLFGVSTPWTSEDAEFLVRSNLPSQLLEIAAGTDSRGEISPELAWKFLSLLTLVAFQFDSSTMACFDLRMNIYEVLCAKLQLIPACANSSDVSEKQLEDIHNFGIRILGILSLSLPASGGEKDTPIEKELLQMAVWTLMALVVSNPVPKNQAFRCSALRLASKMVEWAGPETADAVLAYLLPNMPATTQEEPGMATLQLFSSFVNRGEGALRALDACISRDFGVHVQLETHHDSAVSSALQKVENNMSGAAYRLFVRTMSSVLSTICRSLNRSKSVPVPTVLRHAISCNSSRDVLASAGISIVEQEVTFENVKSGRVHDAAELVRQLDATLSSVSDSKSTDVGDLSNTALAAIVSFGQSSFADAVERFVPLCSPLDDAHSNLRMIHADWSKLRYNNTRMHYHAWALQGQWIPDPALIL